MRWQQLLSGQRDFVLAQLRDLRRETKNKRVEWDPKTGMEDTLAKCTAIDAAIELLETA